MKLLARIAIAAAFLSLLPVHASAETMDGLVWSLSSGNTLGSLTLARNNEEDHFNFVFRIGELHIEGVYWQNLATFHMPDNAGYITMLSCPRKVSCAITIQKTHVRVEYEMREGRRFALNIIALDPKPPFQP